MEGGTFPVPIEMPQDDDTSSANTEDSLISSGTSSETINCAPKIKTKCCYSEKKKRKCCGSTGTLISGIILTVLGITSIIWTPFQMLMNYRLKMSPGLPPYELWKTPPVEVLLRVYLFNITNSEEFLSGTDAKLRLQEIGPIIYRENLVHSNITFNDNGTLTYIAKRTAVFLPEMNTIDLNQTLILPNLAVLGMASYLWDATFFTKFAYNLLLRNIKSQPIVKMSIQDYLWNFTDPLLDVGQTIVPFLVPVNNMGILHRIYSDFEDSVTVYIGPKYDHGSFFLIDKYDGTEFLPGQTTCKDRIINSTEGVAYPQLLTKNSVLNYWRKTLCKVTPLHYDSEVSKYGINAYRFILPNNTFDRHANLSEDCYVGKPPLPSGLSDVSKCYYDFPMAASFPHFLYGDAVLDTFVDGLTPNSDKHDSFVIVEPKTGIPMESRARSQSNLVMNKLTGFNDNIEKFSNILLPMFWAEYNIVGLPFCIAAIIYFTVVVLPVLQVVMSALLISGGLLTIVLGIRRRMKINKLHLLKNQALQFERELFLKVKK